jgi:hypothetical protein
MLKRRNQPVQNADKFLIRLTQVIITSRSKWSRSGSFPKYGSIFNIRMLECSYNFLSLSSLTLLSCEEITYRRRVLEVLVS